MKVKFENEEYTVLALYEYRIDKLEKTVTIHLTNGSTGTFKVDVTHLQNCYNKGLTKANTSGYKGVTLNKKTGKWIAQFQYDGKHIYLGSYTDILEAKKVHDENIRIYHGEYARVK